MSKRRWRWSIGLIASLALVAAAAYAGTQNAAWLTGGQNLNNSRYQAAESVIGTKNVASLAAKFAFTAGGDISATPAVDGQNVYFPDTDSGDPAHGVPLTGGYLYAVNRSTGQLVWRDKISTLTGIGVSESGATGDDYARATPAIVGNTLIIGDQAGKFTTPDWAAAHPNLAGAWVLGIDKNTGQLLWKTRVHKHFLAIVTASAQINGKTAFIGVASQEEAFANRDLTGGIPYTCCSFRGKVLALDVDTGAIKWATYMVPANDPNDPESSSATGWSGGSVWGSTPSIDLQRGALYVATGNNYSLPADRVTCVQNAGTNSDAARACLPDDNFDAIVSLNLQTGAINWSYRALPSDDWNTDCGLPGFSDGGTNPGNCPNAIQGPDFDFGQGPLLFTGKANGKTTDLVGAGEKSGVFTALERSTGKVVWATQVGPGGLTGGLQWGSATDGSRIYAARSNSTALDGGGWSALDAGTGSVLWNTADPGFPLGGPGSGFFGFSAEGPVSTANGVVYGCSLNPVGPQMVAMDAATGAVKWSYTTGSSCLGGAAIANGTVYWGTGYGAFAPLTTSGKTLYAFTPNGS